MMVLIPYIKLLALIRSFGERVAMNKNKYISAT